MTAYIVQIKNPQRNFWRDHSKFSSLDRAIALYRDLVALPAYAEKDIRIWQPAAESRVYVDVPGHLHVAKAEG